MSEIVPTEPKLFITIRSRSKTYLESECLSVTSVNDTGVFDILPMHANFISIVNKYLDVRLTKSETKRFDIKGGVLRVSADKIKIYLTE